MRIKEKSEYFFISFICFKPFGLDEENLSLCQEISLRKDAYILDAANKTFFDNLSSVKVVLYKLDISASKITVVLFGFTFLTF